MVLPGLRYLNAKRYTVTHLNIAVRAEPFYSFTVLIPCCLLRSEEGSKIGYLIACCGMVHSIDFRDSAILIFSSLKYITPFTIKAKPKVNRMLHR